MPSHRSLSPILGFDVSVGILPRKVFVCRDFILRAVATFWVMSLVGIYPGRASIIVNLPYSGELDHGNHDRRCKITER